MERCVLRRLTGKNFWYLKVGPGQQSGYYGAHDRLEWVHCPAAATVWHYEKWLRFVATFRKLNPDLNDLTGVRVIDKERAIWDWISPPAKVTSPILPP